jgi:hypothetical protein
MRRDKPSSSSIPIKNDAQIRRKSLNFGDSKDGQIVMSSSLENGAAWVNFKMPLMHTIRGTHKQRYTR